MVINLIHNKLSRTRYFLHQQLAVLSGRAVIDEVMLDELESVLVQADLGIGLAEKIIRIVQRDKKVEKGKLYDIIRDELYRILTAGDREKALFKNPDGPTIILVLGVNGAGKTTTIAKLAHRFKKAGEKVLLAAGDTFRAAAIEQLEIWAGKTEADLVKHNYRADPSAVVYDALKAACARKMDYLIIDTAGRFHNKIELVDELRKIDRTINKYYPGAPHEKLLVLDASTGQNGLIQAKSFDDALNLTGIIAAKLDGTAKGGILVGIQKELGIPVKFIGIGQDLDDLEEFNPREFVDAII